MKGFIRGPGGVLGHFGPRVVIPKWKPPCRSRWTATTFARKTRLAGCAKRVARADNRLGRVFSYRTALGLRQTVQKRESCVARAQDPSCPRHNLSCGIAYTAPHNRGSNRTCRACFWACVTALLAPNVHVCVHGDRAKFRAWLRITRTFHKPFVAIRAPIAANSTAF